MKRYMITGGAGFIGSNLAEALLKKGIAPVVFDNFSTGRLENVEKLDGVRIIQGDLCDLDQVKAAMEGVEVVFHEGALPSVAKSIKDPVRSNKNNIDGTVNVLLAARDAGVRRVIYAGSSSAYGDSETLPKVETMKENPISPYAISKLTAEHFCKVFSRVYDLDTVVLRYFNIFGPKQDPSSPYSGVISLFVTLLLRREQPVIHGDGEQSRDFTYIENAVNANLLAAEAKLPPGQVINCACGDRVTLNTLYKMTQTLTDAQDIEPRYSEPRKGDIRHSLADISKAKELLGYEPTVGFKEGLRKTVAWYREKMA